MVKEMQERRAAQGSRDSRTSDRSREDDGDARVDTARPGWEASGPLLDPKGKVRRPFVITNQRAEMMRGVFRPGHSLPTMTVEEYLQQEMERGNFLSGGTEEPKKKEIDDNDEEALNAETIKARNWDDFKDDNPKGWGNRGGNVG